MVWHKDEYKLGVVAHASSYTGGGGRRITVRTNPGKSVRSYLKSILKAKGLKWYSACLPSIRL
jgi:hypothetical protein